MQTLIVIDEKCERGNRMPSKESEKRGKNEAVPRSIFAYALRNATWTVSPGATVVLSKSKAISEAVQKAQRKRRPNELEKKKKDTR